MRIPDLQTVIVALFDDGMAVSDIADMLGQPCDFVHDAVLVWWQVMDERNMDDGGGAFSRGRDRQA